MQTREPVIEQKSHSDIHYKARALGALASGFFEAGIGYPFDVYKNKRMLNPERSSSLITRILQTTMGKGYSSLTPYQAIRCCYRGFPPFAIHKTAVGGMNYGLQKPLMEWMMQTGLYGGLASGMGKEHAKLVASLLSGGCMGLLGVSLNPIDRMKLLCQAQGMTLGDAAKQMWNEGLRKQYSGWKETGYRNFLGAGTLFLTKYWTYHMLGVTDHNKPTFCQSLFSSSISAFTMVTASHLPDFAKVRAQMEPTVKMPMISRLFKIAKTEGPRAFLAGIAPKLLGTGLRTVLAMTLSEWLVQEIDRRLKPDPEPENRPNMRP